MEFPTLIIDNFFEYPDKVLEFANTLEYFPDENATWPGKRSDPLHKVNRELFDYICLKIYRIFYPNGVDSYKTSMTFQYIEPHAFDNEGWIHQDKAQFGGIIYLTKDPEVGTGTSLYKPKRGWFNTYSYETMTSSERHFRKTRSYPDAYKDKFDKDAYENVKKFYDDSFEETVRVENIYNRLFMFSGTNYHGVPNFGTKPRLTIAFFGRGILDMTPTPLNRTDSGV